jgi:hypothetical protein
LQEFYEFRVRPELSGLRLKMGNQYQRQYQISRQSKLHFRVDTLDLAAKTERD